MSKMIASEKEGDDDGLTFSRVEAEDHSVPGVVGHNEFSVRCPVLVLGARVIEVLGGDDQGGQEDAMTSTWHT